MSRKRSTSSNNHAKADVNRSAATGAIVSPSSCETARCDRTDHSQADNDVETNSDDDDPDDDSDSAVAIRVVHELGQSSDAESVMRTLSHEYFVAPRHYIVDWTSHMRTQQEINFCSAMLSEHTETSTHITAVTRLSSATAKFTSFPSL